MKTEAALQRYLFAQAKKHFVFARKMQATGRVGFPDVLLASDARAVYVELKSPNGTGRLSKMQEREIKRMRAAGLDVRIIWRKEKVDELIKQLAGEDDPERPGFI